MQVTNYGDAFEMCYTTEMAKAKNLISASVHQEVFIKEYRYIEKEQTIPK